ncbi:hypothetical protein F4778DRAFT_350125 [Xylariomycetidae sp. FL2044]|nr:hypothetical protein F4778DRAFT_350125 [Xylariomycetidae sp. FL2044]
MASGEIPDHYMTYDGRLASFQTAQPVAGRTSNTKGKAPKPLSWPHKLLDPDHFARAGFFFEPTPDYPDNTVCFLCLKQMGGWEENDNPFEEHLRLSPQCGWAIVAGIEVGLGDYALDDPVSPEMLDARKATFNGHWPHEGKRGWKCKTKQLVEAGWKYTPTMDSDDMATCTYCQLALDGWEPKDNPMDEHYRRSPDCQFFHLINQYKQGPARKKARGKGTRTSKASRASSQSIATSTSDMPSVLDQPEHEDSVMTTTSVMTQGGTKRGRAKKGTTAKSKKTRAKKEEPIEVLEDPPEVQEDERPAPPPKTTRGRKRTSDAVDDSVLTNAEAPPQKKRATRGRRSNTVETSMAEPQQGDVSMPDSEPSALPKTKGKKGRASNKRNTRKASAASTTSTVSPKAQDDEHLMDDEELERQLQADLDRPLSEDESIHADSESERRKAPAKSKAKGAAPKRSVQPQQEPSEDHAMFDPSPPHIDDAAIDEELQAMETEMGAQQTESPEVTKKGRKAGTKKTSKQTAKRAKEDTPEAEPETEIINQTAEFDELAEGHEMSVVSVVSDATVVRNSISSTTSTKKRGRPSKKAVAAKSALKSTVPTEESGAAPPHKTAHVDFAEPQRSPPVADHNAALVTGHIEEAPASNEKSLPPSPAPEDLQPPATPKNVISPAPAAKQATISPSQSPQSSDAENQPPSSKPSNTATTSRVALAPINVTPTRASPSKRNVLAGLRSTQPWDAVDIEMIFEDLDKENAIDAGKIMKGGAGLTSPEKRMTVEEWIYHNADEAEKKLKYQCEVVVTAFEKEGTKAMQALEGLIVE